MRHRDGQTGGIGRGRQTDRLGRGWRWLSLWVWGACGGKTFVRTSFCDGNIRQEKLPQRIFRDLGLGIRAFREGTLPALHFYKKWRIFVRKTFVRGTIREEQPS